MSKLQVTQDATTIEILDRLIHKHSKSIFVNMAIKHFASTKEGKKLLKNDIDSTKETKKSIPAPALEKKTTTSKKALLKEWD